MGIFAKKYKVDYCGQKIAYPNAKDKYRAGKKVTLYFDMIATDTNYLFTLDGAELMKDYDREQGYILRFTMSDHDVKLRCVSRNTMLIEMPEIPQDGAENNNPEAESQIKIDRCEEP